MASPVGVGINLDLKDPFGQSARNAQNWNIYMDRSNQRMRNRQYIDSRTDRQEAMRREDTRLQRLMKDAKAAGISPLAALGSPGSAPANINVGGDYPVGSSVGGLGGSSGAMTNLIFRQAEANARKTEAEASTAEATAVGMHRRNRLIEDNGVAKVYAISEGKADFPTELGSPWPDMYVRYNNNIDEAREWRRMGHIPIVNPDANMEPPELVGGAYWLNPRLGNPVDVGLDPQLNGQFLSSQAMSIF